MKRSRNDSSSVYAKPKILSERRHDGNMTKASNSRGDPAPGF